MFVFADLPEAALPEDTEEDQSDLSGTSSELDILAEAPWFAAQAIDTVQSHATLSEADKEISAAQNLLGDEAIIYTAIESDKNNLEADQLELASWELKKLSQTMPLMKMDGGVLKVRTLIKKTDRCGAQSVQKPCDALSLCGSITEQHTRV